MGCYSPGQLPDPRAEPVSLALADGFFTTEPLGKPKPGCRLIPLTLSWLKELGTFLSDCTSARALFSISALPAF